MVVSRSWQEKEVEIAAQSVKSLVTQNECDKELSYT